MDSLPESSSNRSSLGAQLSTPLFSPLDGAESGELQVIQVLVNLSSFRNPLNIFNLKQSSSSLFNGSTHGGPDSSIIRFFECTSPYNCTNLDNPAEPWGSQSSNIEATDFSTQTLSTLHSNDSTSLWWKLINQSDISLSNSSILTHNWTAEPDLRIYHPTLAFFLGFICLMVMFGNILIMVAIRRERYLQTVTNLFVASLAVADCLVGAVVMPSSVVHEVMNKWWIFGQDWCDLWHSFDVLASTASILNLCVISLDRYWAITDPISYPARMTPRKAKILIALVWTCSAIISFPAIIWWRAVSPPPRPFRCDFTEDTSYLVTSSVISFYVPLFIMLVVYFRIYHAAVLQTKSIKTGLKSIPQNDGNENRIVLRIHRGGGGGGGVGTGATTCCSGALSEGHPLKTRFHADSFEENSDYVPSGENGLDIKVGSVRNRNMKAFSISRKLAKLAKERKAAKTLGIVMGVFILCWLPFFIANMVKGLCGDECLMDADIVYSVLTWLGWLNSGMNPFIYACWSKDFRRAFKKILCSCFNSSHLKQRHRKPLQSRYSYHSAADNNHPHLRAHLNPSKQSQEKSEGGRQSLQSVHSKGSEESSITNEKRNSEVGKEKVESSGIFFLARK